MTLVLSELRELLEAEDLRYYLIPDEDGVFLTMKGEFNKYQFKILSELDGEFVQLRSIDYLQCPQGHPNLDVTLQVLGEINYRLRLVKFGWDPADGEIAVYVDAWIVDATVTQGMFHRMWNAFVSIMDDEYPRLKAAIEDGVGLQGTDGSEAPDPDDDLVESL